MSDASWATYADAISGLHRERQQIDRERSAAGAGRVQDLERLGEKLAAQRDALEQLGQQLRAHLSPADLQPAAVAPVPVPAPVPAPAAPVSWEAGATELSGWLARAGDAADEARRTGDRPQLLPGWHSRIARHAVVYAAVVVPNAIFTIGLSLHGVTGSGPLLLWFALVFPVLAAIGGGILAGRLCAPRILSTPDDGTSQRGSRRRHRWLAVLFAWASWLVPGFALDLIAPQLHR
jgi:hypothetical protein